MSPVNMKRILILWQILTYAATISVILLVPFWKGCFAATLWGIQLLLDIDSFQYWQEHKDEMGETDDQ